MAEQAKDLVKLVKSQRPTVDELQPLLFWTMDQVDPASKEDVELVFYNELYDDALEIANHGNKFSGLSTGYPATIDAMTKGLSGGDILVIYGYTSMGKSQLAQNIVLNVAQAGHAVLVIGLELTNKQNAARFIRMGGNDPMLPFIFPKKADITYRQIQSYIRKAKKDGCRLVMVDQLQDLIHDKVNEQAEITQIMAELKRAAIECEVPIIVMSHVNRSGSQPGPPPLETLKGSSSIEQKADIAISVYRDTEAEYGTVGHNDLQIGLFKNRQKGMEVQGGRYKTLKIGKGMRLTEEHNQAGLRL